MKRPTPEFTDWLRRRRRELDLTQATLADHVGCALVTIRKIEQGRRRPSRQLVELLAEHLAIPLAQRETFVQLGRGEFIEQVDATWGFKEPPVFLQAGGEDVPRKHFVGRERELAELHKHLAAGCGGQGRVIFVAGEAGSGKTTLVERFSHRAQELHPDLLVANGSCTAFHGTGDPYLPFRQILAMLTGDVEARFTAGRLTRTNAQRLWHGWPAAAQALVEQGPSLIDVLVRTSSLIQRATASLPETVPWLGRLQELATQRPAAASGWGSPRGQICEELTAVLTTLARETPLLLILDDLHWADISSLDLLFHLARNLDSIPILVVATYRPEDVALGRQGDRHPLAGLLAELKQANGDAEVDLDRRDRTEARDFLDALVDAEPNRLDEAFRQYLFDRTEGHALYTTELIREMQARGDLVQDERSRWTTSGKHSWNRLPVRVEGVIERRIGSLDESLRSILAVGSVEGETFSVQTVARILNTDERLLLRRLSQELDNRHRLVQEHAEIRVGSSHLWRYSFSHALFQRYLYNQLGHAERRLLHLRMGEVLESLYDNEAAQIAVDLAHHFTRAEAWPQAFRYLRMAGDRARDSHAGHEALSLYSQALDVYRRMVPAPDPGELLPLYAGRARAHMLLTQYREAIRDFEEMLRLARAVSDPQTEGESLCALAHVHWLTFSRDGTANVEAYARESLTLARRTGSGDILSKALIRLGSVDQVRGDLPEADRKFGHALDISRREGYTDSLAQALDFLAMQRYLQGDYQWAIVFGQEGLEIYRRIQDGFHELHILAFLCQSLWGAGEYSLALTLLEKTLKSARARDNSFFVGRLLNTLGWFYREFDDVQRAIASDRESLELGRTSGIPNVEISALINLGLDYLALGQLERACSYLKPTLDRVQREAFGAHKWRWEMKLRLGLAEVHYVLGEYEPALLFLRSGLAQAQASMACKYRVHGMTLEARLLLALGHSGKGRDKFRQAFRDGQALGSATLLYPIAFELGLWHEDREEIRTANQMYQKANELVASMTNRVQKESLRNSLLRSKPVRAIQEGVERTSRGM